MSIELPTLDHSVFEPPPDAVDFYVQVAEIARRIGHPLPAVGDLCLVLLHRHHPTDQGSRRLLQTVGRAQDPELLQGHVAIEISIEDERWIGKVWGGNKFFDVIYNISTASMPITDEWFAKPYEVEVYGTKVRIMPPTEFILSKLFLQDRYRYDGADVAHVILRKHDEIDWKWLLDSDGALLGGAAHPRSQFPFHLSDRTRGDPALAPRRIDRATGCAGADAPGADENLQGTPVQSATTVIDIAEWGFADVVGKGIEEKHDRKL